MLTFIVKRYYHDSGNQYKTVYNIVSPDIITVGDTTISLEKGGEEMSIDMQTNAFIISANNGESAKLSRPGDDRRELIEWLISNSLKTTSVVYPGFYKGMVEGLVEYGEGKNMPTENQKGE